MDEWFLVAKGGDVVVVVVAVVAVVVGFLFNQ